MWLNLSRGSRITQDKNFENISQVIQKSQKKIIIQWFKKCRQCTIRFPLKCTEKHGFIVNENIIPGIIATNKWPFRCASSLYSIAAYFSVKLRMFTLTDTIIENRCQTWQDILCRAKRISSVIPVTCSLKWQKTAATGRLQY